MIQATGTAEGFQERDRQAATRFAEAARDAGVQRIVYLGGLGSGPDPTPVYARVGRTLVESLPHETVVHDPSALERFPIRPRSYREAIARALLNEDEEIARTRWSDALSAYGNTLWRLRGFLDLLAGGVALRRGRRDPEAPAIGAALDFWRVEAYEPGRLLRLSADMRVPGRASLQFKVEGDEHRSRVHQTAIFDPARLAGLLYRYALLPLHRLVFAGMPAGVARRAEAAR